MGRGGSFAGPSSLSGSPSAAVAERSADGAPIASLQSGLPEEHQRIFEAELRGCLPALKWLIKEFRLRVGYETPDEEAGIRFWIDRYERLRDARTQWQEPHEQDFPTADEPSLPATAEENLQARRWPREIVEQRLTRLFELRRRLCPHTPILVPLRQLRHYEAPRGFSAKKQRAALHQFREASQGSRLVVQPGGASKRPSSVGAVTTPTSRPKAQALSMETQDRLFPSSASAGTRLSEEQFVSRVIDLAIEFDGDAERAMRDGPALLARGVAPTAAEGSSLPSRRWHEGKNKLEELNLLQFWFQLKDKATLGLMMRAAAAEKLLSDRTRGVGFAEALFGVFRTRFKYECLDVAILYRFWLCMPKSVRSAHHLRGLPERQAFELIREAARIRSELKRAKMLPEEPVRSVSSGKPAWRPSGEAPAQPAEDPAQVKAALSVVVPFNTPSRRQIEELARPKLQVGAAAYLKVLAKHFPGDLALRKMLRQSLDVGGSWRGGSGAPELQVFDLVQQADVLSKVSPQAKPNSVREQLLKLQPGQTSLQLWLATDTERARMTLDNLKKAQEVTQAINKSIRREVAKCMSKGAAMGRLGPYFPSVKNGGRMDLRGAMLVDDLFARLCRQLDPWEVLARFSVDYMPIQPTLAPVIRQSGQITDCATRRASCTASSHAVGCDPEFAVDGVTSTGWRPEPTQAQVGGASWTADLGRLQSCIGLVLSWALPVRKAVVWVTPTQLLADVVLEGGLGAPIKVAGIREGGTAAGAGVSQGDVLALGVGGDGDGEFRTLTPSDALLRLQQDPRTQSTPVRLFFDGLARHAAPQPVSVKVLASNSDKTPTAGDFVKVAENDDVKAAPGSSSEVQAIFVGRWVKLEFAKPWPKSPDGNVFVLSVRVQKVWRLAPPAFRRQVVDVLQEHLRKKASTGAGIPFIPGNRMFWASTKHASSCNIKICGAIERRQKQLHDYEDPDEELMEQIQEYTLYRRPVPGKPGKKEFHMDLNKEVRSWRSHLYALETDKKECTFHPRAAGNVPHKVHELREYVSERTDKIADIRDYVKELGENFDSTGYPNYRIVQRRNCLNKAKRRLVSGHIIAADQLLRKYFGVQQILRRFRCFHDGCGRPLDQTAEMCGCSGYYCATHKLQSIHNCREMKKRLTAEAQEAKKKEKEMRENGETPPPEEKFDNKRELGIIMQVLEVAEAIQEAKGYKDNQRRSLERLEQSLSQFGAIRLAERPFRRQMCSTVLERKRSWSREGGKKVPAIGFEGYASEEKHSCDCPAAHKPSELRFPAGESAKRRAEWVREAIAENEFKKEVIIGTEAARSKITKEERAKTPVKKRSQTPGGSRRRGYAEPKACAIRRSLDSCASEVSRASNLLLQARAQMHEGHLDAARQTAAEVRGLAAQHSQELAVAASLGLGDRQDPRLEAEGDALLRSSSQANARRAELFSQIRALAGDGLGAQTSPSASTLQVPGRPMRACERQELAQRGVEATYEAQHLLQECRVLESQVTRLSQQRSSSQELRTSTAAAGEPAPPQLHRSFAEEAATSSSSLRPAQVAGREATDGGAPHSAGELLRHPREKTQMCVDFLDTGTCVMGASCPYAHGPAELTGRSTQSLEAGSASSFLAIPGYQSYRPQSGQIYGLLKQMQEDFEASLSDAQKAEMKAKEDYEALKAAKEDEISSGRKAIVQLDADLAEYGEQHAQAAQELEDTQNQLGLDTTFLANLKSKCSESASEYDARVKSRLEEIAAVQDTIGILNSDESFDLFDKSVNSPASFLQTSEVSGEEMQARRSRAALVLRRAAGPAHAAKLSLLAASAELDAFEKVKAEIDKMVAELNKQQKDEVEHRDWCTEEIAANGRATSAADDKKAALDTKIADEEKAIESLAAEIASTKSAIADMQEQMKRASENREAENGDFQQTVSDQRLTQMILQKAINRMKQVYAVALEQQEPGAPHIQTSGTHTDPGNGPARFTKYEQHAGGNRVVGLLETVLKDSKQTEDEACSSEEDSQTAYENYMKDSNKAIVQYSKSITSMEEARATSKESLAMAQGDVKSTVEELGGLHEMLGDLHKSCDFVLDNFAARQEARSAEIDSLKEAKAILSGMK